MKLHWPDLTFGPINLLNCPYISLWREPVKTQQCYQCAHRNFEAELDSICDKGHKPKFFIPRSALDQNYGWKRKCADYEERQHVSQSA